MSVFRTLIRAYLKPEERFFLFSEHATLVLVVFVIKILASELVFSGIVCVMALAGLHIESVASPNRTS